MAQNYPHFSRNSGALDLPNSQDDHISALPGGRSTRNVAPGFFGHNNKFVLSGNPTFIHHTHHHDNSKFIMLLYERSAPAAAYNSSERFDPPKCHDNTRIGILNMIRKWANCHNAMEDVDSSGDTSRLAWLYGSAGAGKSAIAQTTSEDLSLVYNLAASFFFSRTAPESSYRGDESRFVTTIAHQLTEVMPLLRSYVENAIRKRPSIFDRTLCEQVMVLIMEPLREVIRDNGDMDLVFIFPKVIVVDGLDECKDEAGQKQVLEAIATLVGHPEIFPFSVFLASRPELAIRTWIASKQSAHPNLIRSVSLLDHCDSDHDIEVFVKAEVVEIRNVHPLRFKIPADWPLPESIREIVKRASGQFVYASTVMKHVKDLRNDPRQRLESILQNIIAGFDRPYAELDALYLHILRQTQHPTLVHRILAFRLVTATFWGELSGLNPQDCLQNLLSLPHPVPMCLIDLQSIMKCSSDGMNFLRFDGEDLAYRTVTSLSIPVSTVFHHASFVEFLLDRRRSAEFYVDRDKFDEYLFQVALKNIRDCASDPEEAGKSEDYVIYCFLTILQTQTSYRPLSLNQLSVELSKWDTLNETMLYNILLRLSVIYRRVENFRLIDIINVELWKHFAPAVERRRVRCHQALESAGLPLELFAISERPKAFGLVFFDSCDPCDVHELLERHILSPFRHGTGAGVRSLSNYSFRAGAAAFQTGFYDFVMALDIALPKQELALLAPQIGKWGWDKLFTELENAVIFYFKQLISFLDPSEDIRKPREINVAFDGLKRRLGEHWRALAAAYLLSGPSHLVWNLCPISKDIVAVLDDISNLFFPPHVISSIEDAALPFDFPYAQSKRDILNSLAPACRLPRWLKSPWDNFLLGVSTDDIQYDFSYLHDYKRIYNILGDYRDGRNRDNNESDTTSTDGDCTDDDAFMMPMAAYHLLRQTIPEMGDNNWSLGERVGNFIKDYKKAEMKHKEMTRMNNSNKL